MFFHPGFWLFVAFVFTYTAVMLSAGQFLFMLKKNKASGHGPRIRPIY